MPEIDLPPHKWVSERERPHEPILGAGAGYVFGELLTLAATLVLLILVGWLGLYFKREVYTLLWGDKPQSHTQAPLQPGQSTVIDGVTIKRIN